MNSKYCPSRDATLAEMLEKHNHLSYPIVEAAIAKMLLYHKYGHGMVTAALAEMMQPQS